MWFDLTLTMIALVPLLLTQPIRARNASPTAHEGRK